MKIKNWICLSVGASIFYLMMDVIPVSAVESSYSGNYVQPETQAGYYAEHYEGLSGQKLQRGLENIGLCFLEIPQTMKVEYVRRKQDYLPAGIETFFLGFFRGVLRTAGRALVGVYEVVTFAQPQGPIMPEIQDWAL